MNSLRDDAELCALFKAECEENLQRIDSCLLRLESAPDDRAAIEQLFRDAHTLKGSAGMVGANEIQAVSHRFEDLLGGARRGEAPLPPETIARLYRAVDIIRKLVDEAVNGTPSGIDIWRVLAELHVENAPGAPPASVPETPPLPEPAGVPPVAALSPPQPAGDAAVPLHPEEANGSSAPAGGGADGGAHANGNSNGTGAASNAPAAAGIRPRTLPNGSSTPPANGNGNGNGAGVGGNAAPAAAPPVPAPPAAAPPVAPAAHGSAEPEPVPAVVPDIEMVRVDSRKLDALMAHSSELTVAGARGSRRIAEMDDLAALWEEIGRELTAGRLVMSELLPAALRGDERAVQRSMERYQSVQEQFGERMERAGAAISRLQKGLAEDGAKISFLAQGLGDGIREIRMLPFSTLFNLFPRLVRDLAHQQGKQVHLIVEGGEITADKRVLEELKDPLMHMLRNAVDHGIETPEERLRAGKHAVGTVRLRAYRTPSSIIVELSDDGRGIDSEAVGRGAVERGIRSSDEVARMTVEELQGLIFASGFSTRGRITDISGRGIGMDVVRANVERLKGHVHLDSPPGFGCTIRIQLPRTLASMRVLTLSLGGQVFALPVESVLSSVLLSRSEIFRMEGRETILFDGAPVPVARLADLLELPGSSRADHEPARDGSSLFCVVVSDRDTRFGLFVDGLVDEQEVIAKHDQALLKRVRTMAGAAILDSGSICIILNPNDLRRSMRARKTVVVREQESAAENRVKTILLVEDSITTRTQMKRILEGAGYEVVTAVDGLDGLSKFGTRPFDAVISDVQMPNMDGLALTAKIRESRERGDLPILLVTSLSRDEDRRRGIEVGASAYLTKPAFDQKVLLDTLRRLI